MRPVIVGLGELLWDLFPSGKQLGGAPANFAYHAHALGAEVHLVTTIGDDALGREALARLAGARLPDRFVAVDPAHPTGTVTVELNTAGQASYTIVEEVAWDCLAPSAALDKLAGRTTAVCFGSLAQRSALSRQTIRRFLSLTPARCLRVFDINLRAPHYTSAVILKSLELANMLKLNDDELPILAGYLGCAAAEPQVFAELFQRYELQLIALTRGAQGATLVTPSEQVDLPATKPEPFIDTVGAGDSFTAAMVTAWLEERPLAEVGRRALHLATFVCSRRGAMPPMSDYQA